MSGTEAVARRDHADGVPRSYTASATHGGVVWTCNRSPRRADGSVPESIEEQVGVALDNLEAVLTKAGSSLASLPKGSY